MSFLNSLRSQLNQYPFFKQFVKFCIVGGTAAVIHFSILFSFTEWLKLWYIYSNGIGFFVSATFNFISNKFWTFRNKEKGFKVAKQIVKFSVVLGTGLTINTLIIYAVTEGLGLDYRLSWVFATGVVMFWNFGFNRFWTFRLKKETETNLA